MGTLMIETKKNISSIIKIQNLFRNKLKIKNRYEAKIYKIYNVLQDLMITINSNFNLGIINQEKYNSSMNKLESIKDDYTSLKLLTENLKILELTQKNNLKIIDTHLENISNCLKEVYWNNGSLSVLKLLETDFFESNKNSLYINKNFNNLLNFYNKIFIPSKFRKFTLSEEPQIQMFKNVKNSLNQIIKFNPNKTDNSETDNQIEIIKDIFKKKINYPVCKCSNNNNKENSLKEIINGAYIYIPYFKFKIIFVIKGFFKNDP